MHVDFSAELWKSATWVLDTERAGRPRPAHRSSWDIAVTAIGLAYTDPARAWRELRGLFEAQQADGRVPHQIVNPATVRAGDLLTSASEHIPAYAYRHTRNDTGIVASPLHALAVWEVYRHSAAHGAEQVRQALAEVAWLYPRLAAQQQYLVGVVECPAFDAVVGAAELALAQMAGTLGHAGRAGRHRERAQAVTAALSRRLWDPATGTFRARDARTGEPGPAHTAGGMLPLLLPDLPAEQAEAIMAEMTSERFGLPSRTGLPLPGSARPGGGPIRIDLNWLLRRGMLVHHRRWEAEELRVAMIGLVHANGHHAEYDPETGEGRGPGGDARTAGLCLDLLADRSSPAYARAC